MHIKERRTTDEPEKLDMKQSLFTKGVAFLALLALLALPRVAGAGDLDDIVFTKGGGRIRGTVLEEDRTKGVTLRLPDGKNRTVKAEELDHVQYGTDPKPAASAETAAPQLPVPLAPRAAPDYAPPAPPKEMQRRSTGMWATGVACTLLGALGIAGSGATLAGAAVTSSSYKREDAFTIGGGAMVGSVVLFVAGIPLWLVGASKVEKENRVGDARKLTPQTSVGLGRATFGWSF